MEKLVNVFKNGINYTNYGKANFAIKLLHYGNVCEDLVKRLMDNPDLIEKLKIKKNVNGIGRNSKILQLEVSEDMEALEKIYDMLIGNRLKGIRGEKLKEKAIESVGQDFYDIEMEQVKLNREIIKYDIVLSLTYFLVMMDGARLFLWSKYGNQKEELINYYKKSMYCKKDFLAYIPGIYMEQTVGIVGLILKCRERDDKEIYNDIINSIRRSNKKMINYIKKLHVVNGESIRMVGEELSINEDDVLLQTSGLIVAIIVAEALGKEIIVDYDLGMYIMMSMKYLNPLYADSSDEFDLAEASEKNKHFLDDFKNDFSANNGISSVIYGIEHDETVTELSEQIYYNYGLSPRKFSRTILRENELNELIELSHSWNNKKYFMALQVAVLCKYICNLESYIEERIVNSYDVELYDLVKKEGEIIKKEKEIEIRNRKLETQIVQLEKRNIELEAELERQKNVIEQKNKQYENEKAELIQLRNYTYKREKIAEKTDDKVINLEQVRKFWLEQSVVLIGGHENWQQKIKTTFPKWKFVTAGQTSFSPDMISDKKYIICNTDILAHSVYYKVIANKTANQFLLYTHGSNLDKFLMELEGQRD